jgi:hypothetical protein
LLWEILSLTQLARYDEAKALIPTYNQAFHTQINAEELFAFAQKQDLEVSEKPKLWQLLYQAQE